VTTVVTYATCFSDRMSAVEDRTKTRNLANLYVRQMNELTFGRYEIGPLLVAGTIW